MLSAEAHLPSHLKWANAGAEEVHTIGALGDGKDTQAVLPFPRTAVVGGGKEKKKNFPHSHFFPALLLLLTQVGSNLLQRKHALV